MKKFIAAFDGLSFKESTLHYAIALTAQCNAHLVGIFLEDSVRHSYGLADITQYEGAEFNRHIHDLDEKDRTERQESIERFEQACCDAGLNHSVHRNRNAALQELLHESVYADLLFVCAGETLTRYEERAPTRFIRDLLHEVLCPVMVVPEKYRHIDKICLLYNGSPSSVFAAKMFSYLFEPLKNMETEVVSVKAADESLHLPDNRLIKEFLKRHYPGAAYVVLQGLASDEIIKHLNRQQKEAIVVLGAYQRSRLSRVFKPSMADYLLQNLKLPLFIAHNKS